MAGTGRSRETEGARPADIATVRPADGSPDGGTVTSRSAPVPTWSPWGEDDSAAVGGWTWRMKASGSDGSSVAAPEAGAGMVGRFRPALSPVASAGSDSGEPGPMVRDEPSPSAAEVGSSLWLLPSKESTAPIVHSPGSACDESP